MIVLMIVIFCILAYMLCGALTLAVASKYGGFPIDDYPDMGVFAAFVCMFWPALAFVGVLFLIGKIMMAVVDRIVRILP